MLADSKHKRCKVLHLADSVTAQLLFLCPAVFFSWLQSYKVALQSAFLLQLCLIDSNKMTGDFLQVEVQLLKDLFVLLSPELSILSRWRFHGPNATYTLQCNLQT